MEIKIVGTPEELAAFALKVLGGKTLPVDEIEFKKMVNQFLTMYGTSLKPKEWSEADLRACSCS